MKKLYLDKKAKRYKMVMTDEDLHCTFCNTVIELGDSFFIHKSYSKKEYVKNFYCVNCIKNHKKRIYDEFLTVEVTNTVPDNSIIVADAPPSLVSGNASVFTAAISNQGINADCSGGVEVQDNTKLSGRESLEGSSIGRDMTEQLEHLDGAIEEEDALKLLGEIQRSEPVTEKEHKKLLTTQ